VTKSQRVTNSSGTVTSTIDLDPWGGETNRSANSAFQPHKYTTYERDGNGGDDAMMRRYTAKWHRFSQPDPYDGSYSLSDPQSFNRYAYTQNDPVNFVDPSGLNLESGGGGGCWYRWTATGWYDGDGNLVDVTNFSGGVTCYGGGNGGGGDGGGGGGGGSGSEGEVIPPGNVVQTMFNLLESERCENFIATLLNTARQLTGVNPMSYSVRDVINTIAADPDGGIIFSPGYSGGLGGGEAGYGLGGPAIVIGGEGVAPGAPHAHTLAVQVNYALTGLHEAIHLAPGGGRSYNDRTLAQAVFVMFGDPKDDPSKVTPSRRAVYDYGGIWDKYLREYCGARM
jgi:RHS repeat-associated protein